MMTIMTLSAFIIIVGLAIKYPDKMKQLMLNNLHRELFYGLMRLLGFK